jgi:multiple sugar transport system substrate-binding protein
MTDFDRHDGAGRSVARQVVKFAVATTLAASLMGGTVLAQNVDLSKWSPEYVKSIAGTKDFDAAKECGAVVPNDYAGSVSYWYTGPFEADPQISHDQDKAFWDAFHAAYPNIKTDVQSITYNELLDKFRTALLGNAAPMVIRLQILGGVEFAAKGYLQPVKPEDFGYTTADFWPGALKSVTYDNTLYGLPTNNETMAFIWNAKLFKDAGLDPESPPKTWDDVVAYSKQIHDKLGVSGYGLVAKQNAGNTPFRFMPQLWAYGGGSLDEASANPTYKQVEINNAGSKAALQAAYQMYAVDKSVPTSALTNTQGENQAPFIAGQLGMMIAHPSEYAKMLDLASKATGSDKQVADDVVANMRYGLMPTGPDGKRAVVFGGSNIHVVKPEFVEGGKVDEQAVRALICMWDSPEWSTKLAWVSSNPGNINGFLTSAMKERLDTIKFLDVTTSMLPSGIPFPVLPESPEIMNIIVPDMLQNALTGTMTVDQATEDAAKKIEGIIGGTGGL